MDPTLSTCLLAPPQTRTINDVADWWQTWLSLDGAKRWTTLGPASTLLLIVGALRFAHRLYADASPLWAAAGDDAAAQRWRRGAPLFEVAGSAREQRAARAWERLAERSVDS